MTRRDLHIIDVRRSVNRGMTPVVDDLATRVEHTTAMLRAKCAENGVLVSGDERVGEPDAEQLLGYSAEYLRKQRDSGSGPQAYRLGLAGARVSYRLSDLAEWIEWRRI